MENTGYSKEGKDCFCQIHIGLGFQLSRNGQLAVFHKHVGKHESGNKLAGNAPVNGVFPAFQLTLTANGIFCGTGKGAAHTLHLFPQG